MVDRNRIRSAADEILAAAMVGDGWEEGLQQLAEAADAGGATLLRLRTGRPLAVLTSTGWLEAWAEQIAGDIPPSPRRFFPDRVFERGFLSDTGIWPEEELRRDPFYQEFLRPHGVFYHAKARFFAEGDERVSLSIKRFSTLGPYEPAEIAVLDTLLPELHMAFRIARRVLDAEASGMARVLHHRGDPVFELDACGRVLRVHGEESERLGVVVRERRMVAADRLAQAALDRAVAAAARPPRSLALVPVTNRRGERRLLHVVPVTGRARDIFLATAAIVVVTEPDRTKTGPLPAVIRQALGLTPREAQIAALLAAGLSLPMIAERLHLGIGTMRNHLKSIFGKTDTRRQGELIALLLRLQL